MAGGARIGDWEGLGSSAYDEAIRRLGTTADAMSLALRAVGQRVERHADELAHLLDRRVGLLEERRHLLDRAAALVLRAHGVPPELVATLVAERAEHAATVRGFEAELDRWLADLVAEEEAVRAALAGVLTRRAGPGAGRRVGPTRRTPPSPPRRPRAPARGRARLVGRPRPRPAARGSSPPPRAPSATAAASPRGPATRPTPWPSTATWPSGRPARAPGSSATDGARWLENARAAPAARGRHRPPSGTRPRGSR